MVFKNLTNKERAYGTLALFGIIAFAFWYISDGFSLWVSEANPWLALFVAIIINPAYLFLIYVLYTEYGGRGIVAGILISTSVDIITLTHTISNSGVLPTGVMTAPLYGFADTTFYKAMYPYFNGSAAVFVLYVVIPVILVYIALRVIRRTSSFNKILKETI